MHPSNAPHLSLVQARNEANEFNRGKSDFSISDQLRFSYDADERALWSIWKPNGIPCFNIDLLKDLQRASAAIENDNNGTNSNALNYIVLRSAIRGVFSVGGDLGYFQQLISAKDRSRMTEYAKSAVDVVYRNYISHNLRAVTTIALLEGDALGGGLECAISSDIVIAEEHVRAGFPEVLFNMFPGMGGLSFLARRVGKRVADDMVRTGRLYSATELYSLGVVDQVVETGRGPSVVREVMRRRSRQLAAHQAMNRVDRIVRPVTLDELNEVVHIWVDNAMKLSPSNLEWMHRLHHRQLSVFAPPPVSGNVSAQDDKIVAA